MKPVAICTSLICLGLLFGGLSQSYAGTKVYAGSQCDLWTSAPSLHPDYYLNDSGIFNPSESEDLFVHCPAIRDDDSGAPLASISATIIVIDQNPNDEVCARLVWVNQVGADSIAVGEADETLALCTGIGHDDPNPVPLSLGPLGPVPADAHIYISVDHVPERYADHDSGVVTYTVTETNSEPRSRLPNDLVSSLVTSVRNLCPRDLPSCFSCGPNSCGTPCCETEREPGFEISYPSDCTYHVADWRVKPGGGLICHLDKDTHWNEIDIELYGVDLLEDTSCANHPDRYRKSKKATVSCSLFTGIFRKSKCQRRVEGKLEALGLQGYLPIVVDVDIDRCPTGGPTCTSPAQCDDGRYCNGVEICHAGACIPGTPPCTGRQTCNESTDRCTSPPPPRPDCGGRTGRLCP